MKIGIVTFTNGTNIGQRLQNFALQTLLENEGHEVYTIIFKMPYEKGKRLIKRLFNLVFHYDEEIILIYREKIFREFNEKYIRFNKEKVFRGKETSKVGRKYDLFFAGSDQIWNPNSPIVDDKFFLEFCPNNKRRTYAPSFSVDSIPDDKKEVYKRRLSGFERLSVREYTGGEIIHDLLGTNAKVVLDPTLLIDRNIYDRIKKTYNGKPPKAYCILYTLGQIPNKLLQELKNCAFDLCILNNLSIIGPHNFLDLLSDAVLVVTDSYHITIFSIIYHIPFVNYDRNGNGEGMNSRFDTLYSLLGIKNRKWTDLKEINNENWKMDFSEIDIARAKYREESYRFLLEELKR